jgi:hypothetical protein
MYVLMRYPVGVVVEGVILANRKNRLRVAAAGFADTLELKRSGTDWLDAGHERVQLEFIMPQSSAVPCQSVEEPVRTLRAAGFADAN